VPPCPPSYAPGWKPLLQVLRGFGERLEVIFQAKLSKLNDNSLTFYIELTFLEGTAEEQMKIFNDITNQNVHFLIR